LSSDLCHMLYPRLTPCRASEDLPKPAFFSDKESLNWMKSISNDTLLSGLSIPGTHESLSHFQGVHGACQALTLQDQLRAGVRYLDLRVGIWINLRETSIECKTNGKFWKYVTLHQALEEIFKYLKKFPSEAVLVKISISSIVKEKVLKIVKETIGKFKSQIWDDFTMPSLGEVRGKVVLVQSKMLHLGVDKKKSYFLENGELTKIAARLRQFDSTLCQSYVTVTSYRDNAGKKDKDANGKIAEVVKMQREKKSCLGVVSMDFPSPALIGDIIDAGHCRCSRGNQNGGEGRGMTTGEGDGRGANDEGGSEGRTSDAHEENSEPDVDSTKASFWTRRSLRSLMSLMSLITLRSLRSLITLMSLMSLKPDPESLSP
uniref:Phosphatidylinositol-specific phospholipase C X domain-containing protein n=1 Tax=Neogobius melanostomus TaxID=47308 RepID=A0A8C6TIJ0_9GOBI